MSSFVYDAEIASRYDAAVGLQEGDVEFFLDLAREAQDQGLRTLEVTCGTGRYAIPLAREGIPLVGIDISPDMLAIAREKSAGLDNVEWVEGDMRDFDLGEQFGLVMIPAGSFQLLTEVEDHLATLRCIHRHLVPGGRFAFEVENPDIVSMGQWLTTRAGTLARIPHRDYQHPETGLQVRSWGTQRVRPSVQERISINILDELDGDGVVVRRSYGQEFRLRYFHRYEVEHMLARCGFEVEALYGDLRKSPYRGTSPDLIWVAKRSAS